MTLFGNFLCLAPLYVKKGCSHFAPPLDGIEVCINVRIGKYFPERKRASKTKIQKRIWKQEKTYFYRKVVQSAQITNMHATPNNRTRESDSSWSIHFFSCESKKIVLGRHYPDIEGRLHLRFATGWRVINVRKKGGVVKANFLPSWFYLQFQTLGWHIYC